MPGTPINNSANISLLDSKIVADLCAGVFYVDITPSIWIGSGEENVTGAKVQITNPFGVVIKPYGSSYEIAPSLSGGMDAAISFNVPTIAGNYQYGNYKVDVQLTDGSNAWVVSKTVSICEPDKNNKTRSYGSLSAQLNGICKDGKVYVIVDTVPNYKGAVVESQVNDFTLLYPTVSEVSPLETSYTSFSVQLYEGEYKISGEICATYNLGDNIYVKIKYKVKREKDIKCIIDECCVFAKLEDINFQINASCTPAEKEKYGSITLEALRLLKTAQLAGECGKDPSEYITELENLLECRCTCNCNEGAPIINNEPSSDILIEGCGFTKETVGLTTIYTFNNYEYAVSINENGILTKGDPSIGGCTVTTPLNFSISAMYGAVKNLASPDASFWQDLVEPRIEAKVQEAVDSLDSCCDCEAAAIFKQLPVRSGADVTVYWDYTGDPQSFDIYLDGVFKGNVLANADPSISEQFTFVGAADSSNHEYSIIPKCSNGVIGTIYNDSFLEFGCPLIAPATVEPMFDGVDCPFDLLAELPALEGGYDYEVHNQENTNNSSLVSDPTNLLTGIYYVYIKQNDTGCYSIPRKVTIICEAATTCTAPQNLIAQKLGICNNLVRFQSAAYPPPGNSYTIKRKHYSDPDVPGSYTTIGTPTYSISLGWSKCDSSAVSNTLYDYIAQSNCGDSPETTPSITYRYAYMSCHTVLATPASESIAYSLSTSGSNDIDKYEVMLYDSTGTVLIKTDTFTPAFANPITGNFLYLTPSTQYKIVVKAYIGDYAKESCSVLNTSTTA